jgi:hypothetical protein
LRIDNEEPRTQKSKHESAPTLDCDLIDSDDPQVSISNRLNAEFILCCPVFAAVAKSESPEPSLEYARSDKLDPKFIKLQLEMDEPIRTKLRTDRADPISHIDATEISTQLPSWKMPTTDIDEPNLLTFRIDNIDPILIKSRTDRLEPDRAKDLRESEDATLPKS